MPSSYTYPVPHPLHVATRLSSVAYKNCVQSSLKHMSHRSLPSAGSCTLSIALVPLQPGTLHSDYGVGNRMISWSFVLAMPLFFGDDGVATTAGLVEKSRR